MRHFLTNIHKKPRFQLHNPLQVPLDRLPRPSYITDRRVIKRKPASRPAIPSVNTPPVKTELTEPRRWARRKAARPQELVAAALDIFVERGYAATRLEDVARAAGVSKGTVYLYFSNKEELFKTVVRENLVTALSRGTDLVDNYAGSTPALLRELLHGWWGLVGATRLAGLTKLIMAESGNFPDIARFYQEEVMAPADELFNRVLARGVSRGELRPMPDRPTTMVICGPVVFLMLWQRAFSAASPRQIEPAAFLDHLLDVLLYGLTTDLSRRTPLPPQVGPYAWQRIGPDGPDLEEPA